MNKNYNNQIPITLNNNYIVKRLHYLGNKLRNYPVTVFGILHDYYKIKG